MKQVCTFIFCILFTMSGHSQQNGSNGITLLWVGGSSAYWNDSMNWKEINAPAGQTPLRRVPTELDDVVFSKAMSGLSEVGVVIGDSAYYINPYPYLTVGKSDSTGYNCRSIHVSGINVGFLPDGFESGFTLNVYSENGGNVIIDSGSIIRHIIFNLFGGNQTVTGLTIENSTVGQLTSHAVLCSISLDSSAKARLIGSEISTWGLISVSGGNFYVKDCILNSPRVYLGDNSVDTFVNTKVYVDGGAFVGLEFFIGKNSHFVSSNVNIESFKDISFTTSGSVFNGNLKSDYADGSIYLKQEDPSHQLPNIINGNLEVNENNNFFSLMGDLKISGNFISHSVPEDYFQDTAAIFVNDKYVFRIGGFPAYGSTDSIVGCDQGFCHFSIEFFGDSNSNILWPIGFPVDTLIVNKTNCAKVTFANSLYVSGETQIKRGQLRLEANDTIPYKMVSRGDVKISQGGGLLLAKNAAGKVANIAIGGSIYDANSQTDSSCSGFSNPYNGLVTMYNRNQGSDTGNSGITLLWVGGSSGNWNDSLNWKQMNAPAGQTPLQRVPTELDDVVFSRAMSGTAAVKLYLPDSSANNLQPTLYVGRKNTTEPFCKSLRVSATSLTLPDGIATATSIEVYTDQGGHITIDSASEVPHVLFSLHGGDTSVTDLTIDNSSVGTLFSHSNWGSISVDSLAKVRLTRSIIGGAGIFGTKSSGRFYAKDCVFNCNSVSFGRNSIDSLFSSTFRNDGNNPNLSFLVGRNAHFFTSQVDLESNIELHLTTSGSVLNGNVKTDSPAGTGIFFDQVDPTHPMANIVNGNIDMAENNAIPIQGQLKISGNLVSHSSILNYYYDSATVTVNNKGIFMIGGISNYGTTDTINNGQHFSIEFFGDKNSNVYWPLAFPVDTLIVNKSNCAKVTFTNPLYVSGEAQIKSGQLVLNPNDSITYKMVCRGNVNIANGGGLFLRKDGKGNVAGIAVGGKLSDANSQADSACSGFSNPYNGLVTFVVDATEPEFTVDFSGKYVNQSILLKWNTENEFHTKNFTIEKMNGQNTFTTIAMIPAGKQSTNAYQFIDTSGLSPTNYFRLKISNLDGSYSYSNIVTVFAPAVTMITYPNPVKDYLFLWLPQFTGNANLVITDANGSVVRKEIVNQGTNNIKINILKLSTGVYVAVLQMRDSKQTVKFLKE